MAKPISTELLNFYQHELGTMSIALRVIAWLAAGTIISFGFILAKTTSSVGWLYGAISVSALLSITLHMVAEGVFSMHSNLNYQLNEKESETPEP